ncbi:aspartate--tRNA ligase [Gottschalkiaceae bacterium SANA]|nr:aspartate--tRNA ligase [Gottschalkiaceae bacterium SANA]
METMGNLRRTHYCGELRESNVDENVVLMGWVQKRRSLGGLVFVDLRDTEGICQIVFDPDDQVDLFEKASSLRSEFVIAVKGLVKPRESVNSELPSGKIEVVASELRILDTAETPPIYIKDDDQVSETKRLQYRYLDLRKASMQNRLKLRAKVAKVVRDFYEENRFIEVETPMLNKPTPEGARDYLVPSRVNPGKFYALPQSPQIMKQLLMVSGMDRYYQIVKCFRDEDLRANRQPEFTQIDVEMSFVDVEDIIELHEKLIARIFREIRGIEFETPFMRLTYKEAMERFGSDKPDLRFGSEITDLGSVFEDSEFKVFSSALEGGGTIRAINAKGCATAFSKKGISKLEKHAKLYGAKGLIWVRRTEEGLESSILKFLKDTEIEALFETMDAEAGDMIFLVSGDYDTTVTALGQLRLEIARKMDWLNPDEFKVLWITEFPVFEYSKEADRYMAKHHPFTHPMEEDIEKMETDPKNARAKAYDIVINGEEIGGGSIRINNGELQAKMFKALGFTEEEAMHQFGFLINAFRFGTPPHGGIAFGLDRLVMTLSGTENIRDVVAFPKTQSATCLMTEAPTTISQQQLDEANIRVEIEEKE